jgi:mannose-6-phosphate isomerase-like protein (cupin superfamily)
MEAAMRILAGGCRVFTPNDEASRQEGNRTYRMPICKKNGAKELAQTVAEYESGRSPARLNPNAEEVLYVVSGRGACSISGFDYDLEPGTGVYVPPGADYRIENPGSEKLLVVSVCCPEDAATRTLEEPPAREKLPGAPPRRTVREWERLRIPVADRHFTLMVDKELGCRQVTQFIGFIPPSKAPFHYHTYEEAIYIIEGSGVVHAENESQDFGPGTSIYFPIGVRHCVENPGVTPIRLLGVFYPSGSPAAAYEE